MISVVMASYLGDYPNCATRREERFLHAITSFLIQSYTDSELVIVSDGCDLTQKIYEDKYKNESRILFDRVEKEGSFSGSPRNKGISIANGNVICYLDSDDFIGKNHLKNINKEFDCDLDWVFYDDFLIIRTKIKKMNVYIKRSVSIHDPMRIGTCSIAHKKDLPVLWEAGYGHDHGFIKKLKDYKNKRIRGGEYFISHIPYLDAEFDLDNRDYLIR